jgi:hypothetical protein
MVKDCELYPTNKQTKMKKEERKHTTTHGGRWGKGRDDLEAKEQQMEKKNGTP